MVVLSSQELSKTYGRGYLLLKKAGLTEEDESLASAPIQVLTRRPREGLKDNDAHGRKSLGADKQGTPDELLLLEAKEKLGKLTPQIEHKIRSAGGSYPVIQLCKELTALAPGCSYLYFMIAMKEIRNESFRFSADDKNLILSRPQHIDLNPDIACACGEIFSSDRRWSIHVLRNIRNLHARYEQSLQESMSPTSSASCLACHQASFNSFLALIGHCSSEGDAEHELFGGLLLRNVLLEGRSIATKALLITAIELGDKAFPWKSLVGGAADPLESIPFSDGERIPIALDSDDDEPLEIVEIDSDPDSHRVIGVIDLEE